MHSRSVHVAADVRLRFWRSRHRRFVFLPAVPGEFAGDISTCCPVPFSTTLFRAPSLLWPQASVIIAFLLLKHSEPQLERPYHFPGSIIGAWVATIVCLTLVSAAMYSSFSGGGERLNCSLRACKQSSYLTSLSDTCRPRPSCCSLCMPASYLSYIFCLEPYSFVFSCCCSHA